MQENNPAVPGDRPGFALHSDGLIEGLGEVARPSRSAAGAPADFDAALYAQADLLEVHFADGSVYFTDPQEFAARQAAGATRAGGSDGRVRLPFSLQPAGDAGVTRSAASGVPVDHYRIARLTPPTTLDQVYGWGDRVAALVDGWLGGAPSAKAGAIGAGLCHAFESSQLDASVGDSEGALLAWHEGAWMPIPPAFVPAGTTDVLLLLHGTASSTRGSFAGLWEAPGVAAGGVAPDWSRLASQPGMQVLAYEHRSLSLSPVANVLHLVDRLQAAGLPAGVRLHMLSHSRGGLVGELLTLVLGAADEVQPRVAGLERRFLAFYGPDHPDLPRVRDLLDRLRGAAPGWRAGTFVRVACPARGTLLADRRTDFFLSLLLRSVGLAFGVTGNRWYEPLQALVRGLVASRADARRIPGLEAMIPGAPLSLVLNALPGRDMPAVTLPGRLRVVAGDTQGTGPMGLASLLGDVFYGLHDHDFVVHTHAMFGGFARVEPMSLRVSDRSVTHFGYFKPGAPTRAAVIAALLGQDTGFARLADDEARTRGLWQALFPDLARRTPEAALQALAAPGAERKPILVVLPGIMGSELGREGQADDPVWLAPGSMFNGELALVDLKGSPPLVPTGLLAISYERVLQKASARFHVVGFPFDWRRSIPDSAGRLIDLLRLLNQAAANLDVPVHVLAHSMGGLVARVALWCDDFGLAQRRGDLTRQLEARGLRLLQCGTPNLGSYAPVQLLMQQHPLTRSIARLARGVTPRDLARFGAAYPGLLGMLPARADPLFGDLFQLSNWSAVVTADAANAGTEAAITTPDPAVLAEAAKVRDWLVASFDELRRHPQVFYLAGQGTTPLHLKVIGGSLGRPGLLRLGVSPRGDGTVPWTSTLAPERTFYVECEHGSLLDHVDAFGGMFDLLLGGRTRQLSSQPPALRGDDAAFADAVFELPAVPSLLVDPAAHVLGLDRRGAETRRQPPIRVRIVHGSLDYARHPLLVGHCSDDGVHGAVKRVDAKLKGQLTQAVGFGLFNGALGTSLYLRDAAGDGRTPAFPGAIVVGLGPLGTLTPAGLADSLARGTLDHAFARLHQEVWPPEAGMLVLKLSTVLMGSNTHAMSVRDSLTGILQGLWRAAQALAAEPAGGRRVQIGELEIIELHETVALDAAYALSRLLERPDWQQRVQWPQGVLEAREGGIRGYRNSVDMAQWQRLMVRCDEFGAMKFELIAERARVESTRNRADVFGLEDFIARACDAGAGRLTTPAEQDEFGRALYNQLLPQVLRGRLANFERTVLLVDDRSARMPWELLAPPRLLTLGEEAAQPLAIQAGLLRQRVVEEYRLDERPRLRRPGARWRALVVGDPDTDGWRAADGHALSFVKLNAAVDEAVSVARQLADLGWQVEPLIRDPARLPQGASYTDLRWQLMRPEPWRVLHLAGHGMVDLWMREVQTATGPMPVRGTGMVLSGQQMLTADVVELMDPAPEFVFINCCYSGRDGSAASPAGLAGRPEIAASLALAFIRMGSKAVVAAGWQVDDADGREFADTLYRCLLRGDTFGSAVLAARLAIWRDGRPRSNTWGAYQCYGDPEWRLLGADAAGGEAENADPLAGAEASKSPQELSDRILQVQHGAGDGRSAALTSALKSLLRRLGEDTTRAAWLNDSLVQASLAQVWRELNEKELALEAAFKAMSRPRSQLTLGQAESVANLWSKAETHHAQPLTPQQAERRSWDALERFDALAAALNPALARAQAPADAAAAERECLRASALARRAERDAGLDAEQRRRLLLAAASRYARAFHAHRRLGERAGEQSYALSNAAMLAGIVAVGHDGVKNEVAGGRWWREVLQPEPAAHEAGPEDGADHLKAVVEAIDTTLDALQQDDTVDFWDYAGMLDLRVGRLLLSYVAGQLDAPRCRPELKAVLAAVERALLCWPSPGQLQIIAKRPRQVLEALQRRRGADGAPSEALDLLIETLQAVNDAIEQAAARLNG